MPNLKKEIIFFFLLSFVFIPRMAVFAFGSFEIYNKGTNGQGNPCSYPSSGCTCPVNFNCTPYPTVTEVKINGDSGNVVTDSGSALITAKVSDVSGVYSVVAKIKKSDQPSVYKAVELMWDDGSGIVKLTALE